MHIVARAAPAQAAAVSRDAVADERARGERFLLACGIAFAALQFAVLAYFAAGILPHMKPPGFPVAERVAAYVAMADVLRVGNYLMILPAPLLLLFIGGVTATLWRCGPSVRPLLITAVAAGAAMVMLWPLGAIVSTLTIDIALAGGDPATIAGLDAIAPFTLALAAFPRAVFAGALSWVILGERVAPRWIGRLGFGAAAAGIGGSLVLIVPAFFPLLALGLLLFLVWTAALATALLRRR